MTRLSVTGDEVLISGGADGRIIVWNVATGNKIHVLKAHLRGVLDLAVLPPSESEFAPPVGGRTTTQTILFGAGGVGEIRRFAITPEEQQIKIEEVEPEKPIQAHETSIFKLLFDADGDLWTASADGDVVCLGLGLNQQQHQQLKKENGWTAEEMMRIKTGSWTRGVAIDEIGGWVLSGGRDEDVKVWDRASGELYHVFRGHFDEITGLVVLQGGPRQVLVSTSLDGTVRRWSLKGKDLQAAKQKQEEEAKKAALPKP